MPVTTYIGFGSNLGDLSHNFDQARLRLTLSPEITVLRVSPLYHSEPLTQNGDRQPWYLNAVFEIQTSLSLHDLFARLKAIETDMGRKSRRRWAARLIDLDILFYGPLIYSDDVITVPHPEIIHRRFVLKPLCDLVPDFIHPDLELSLSELLENTDDKLKIRALASCENTGFQI